MRTEQLRKESSRHQASVEGYGNRHPFCVPMDGTNIPGGICKGEEGRPLWFSWTRRAKVGAERGLFRY